MFLRRTWQILVNNTIISNQNVFNKDIIVTSLDVVRIFHKVKSIIKAGLYLAVVNKFEVCILRNMNVKPLFDFAPKNCLQKRN